MNSKIKHQKIAQTPLTTAQPLEQKEKFIHSSDTPVKISATPQSMARREQIEMWQKKLCGVVDDFLLPVPSSLRSEFLHIIRAEPFIRSPLVPDSWQRK